MIQTHALCYVTVDQGRLVTSTGEEFDLQKYSRFKHGSGRDAQDYGEALGRSLIANCPELLNNNNIVIASAPYRTVPKGAQGIANYLIKFLNRTKCRNHPVKRVNITAINPPADTDYSSLTEAERIKRNNRVLFSVNEADFIGKTIFVVDDTRITGGTESKIIRLFDQLGLPLSSVTMLYVACLDPEKAKEDPTIEDRMNTAYVKTLSEQTEIIMRGRFILNPRVIQFVLNPKNKNDLKKFAETIDLAVLNEILSGIITDNYHTQPNYVGAYEILKSIQSARSLSGPKEEVYHG